MVSEMNDSDEAPVDVNELVKLLRAPPTRSLELEAADALEAQAARIKELEAQLYGTKGEVSTTGIMQEAVEFQRSWRDAEERIATLSAEIIRLKERKDG